MTILRNIITAAICAACLLMILGILVQNGIIKPPEQDAGEKKPRRMRLQEEGDGYKIYLDQETGICYLMPDKGSACIMADHAGNPYLTNGWRDIG